MGYDLFQVQDFLENFGVCHSDINSLISAMTNPNYRNLLKMQAYL